MKPTYLLFSAACFFAATFVHGAILTVDNSPSSGAQYATIAAAVSAAANYDTLLVQPSTNSYGNLTLTKPLTIIGFQHNDAANNSTEFGNITCNSGSAGSVIDGVYVTNAININTSNIVVSNCRALIIGLNSGANNVILIGNVISSDWSTALVINTSLTGVLISNNYVGNPACCGNFAVNTPLVIGGSPTTTFVNNVFVRNGSTTSGVFFSGTFGSAFLNNVFFVNVASQFNPGSCVSCTFNNNLSYAWDGGTVAALGGTNYDNTAPTWNIGGIFPLFSYSHNYNMLSGVPLTGASDGGQIGLHGGTVSFNNQGYPRGVPRVTSANVLNPIVPQGGEVQVNFSATQGQP